MDNKLTYPCRFIALSLILFMASPYAFPGYTDNIFRFFFLISFALSIRIIDIRALLNDTSAKLIIALIAYTSISSIWAHDSGRYAIEAAKDGIYLIIALFVVLAATKSLGYSRTLNLLATTTIICSVLVVTATFTLAPSATIEALATGSRLTHRSFLGMAPNPIHSGFFVGLGTLFSIDIFRSNKDRKHAFLFLSIAILLGSFVLLTKSRGAIIFLAISISALIYLVKPTNRQRDIWLASIAATILACIFVFKSDLFLSRLGGESIRMEILSEYLAIFRSSPLFGVGWSEDMGVLTQSGIGFSKPHNSFFHVLVAGGIAGFSIFIILTLRPLWFAIKSKNKETTLTGLWFLFGCLYIAVDGRYPIRQPSPQWLYYWIPLYLLISQMINNNKEKTTPTNY